MRRLMRVASVLPSATELLCAIGGEHLLVARSHEDNFPVTIIDRPIITGQISSAPLTSAADIDQFVSDSLKSGKSLYTLDSLLLKSLKPDIILTQDICSVCAIDLETVERISQTMDPRPKIVSLNPTCLQDVLNDLLIVGAAVGLQNESIEVKKMLDDRVSRVIEIASMSRINSRAKKVAFIEWSDPVYVGGHWTPELISLAGGYHTLNPVGEGAPGEYVQLGGAGKSFPVPVTSIIESDPDIIIIAPCGLNLAAAKRETEILLTKPWFNSLRAVQSSQVFVVDGDAMFNRPGPRLVEALEWLLSIFHPTVQEAVDLCPPDFPFEHLLLNPLLPTSHFSLVPPLALSTDTSASSNSNLPNTSTDLPSDASLLPTTSLPPVTPVPPSLPPPPSSLPQPPPTSDLPADIEELHQRACAAGQNTYCDPLTGYTVFTELAHQRRGKCCGNKCRHCPFGHFNVHPEKREKHVTKTTYFRTPRKSPPPAALKTTPTQNPPDILFWSGGKDSYLALRSLQKQYQTFALEDSRREIILLTTFQKTTGMLPQQGIAATTIMDQAKHLELDLILVPLPDNCANYDYINYINEAIDHLIKERNFVFKVKEFSSIDNNSRNVNSNDNNNRNNSVSNSDHNNNKKVAPLRFVFGDLWLEDIRKWREESFPQFQCIFPLFGADYNNLLDVLWGDSLDRIQVIISNINDVNIGDIEDTTSGDSSRGTRVAIGSLYNQSLIDRLPTHWDKMGEKGEFHTQIVFI